MKIIKTAAQMQREMEKLRRQGKTIGFVPTMGALHAGHLSLVSASKKENAVTAVSIFVNPAQFGPKEDLKKYPRPLSKDKVLLKKAKTDYLFLPSAAEIYPEKFSTFVEPDPALAGGLCGKFRPGHFRGVATVVAKLFNIVKPHRAYFGLKDYQQAAVISRMVKDLNFDIQLRLMPTVREKDGLAMSSRNQYLNAEERRRALAVSRALFGIRENFKAGNHDLAALKRAAIARLKRDADSVDYVEIVDAETLEPLKKPRPLMAVLAAVRVGKTRLIDNVIIRAPQRKAGN